LALKGIKELFMYIRVSRKKNIYTGCLEKKWGAKKYLF